MELTRADIKESNYSTVPKSNLFEEGILESILELQCTTDVAETILENDTSILEHLNKNTFRNIFRLFCSLEQNSRNGNPVFRNENSSQANSFLHYSNYSYSGLIPNERALSLSASSVNSLISPVPQFNVV